MKEVCDKCGEVLLFGMYDQEVFWCPTCEGVTLEPVGESLKWLRSELTDLNKETYNIIRKYNKESLLIAIYITREGMLHSNFFESDKFMAYTKLLKLVIEEDYNGNVLCDPFTDDFQLLIRLAEETNKDRYLIRLVRNRWLRTIKLKEKDIPKYGFRVEESVKCDSIPFSFKKNDIKTIVKFTTKWQPIMNNLRANGFLTKTDILDTAAMKTGRIFLDEFWMAVKTKICMELGTGDFDLLSVEYPQDALQYMRVFDYLTINYPFEISVKKGKGWRKFALIPTEISEVFYPFYRQQLDLHTLQEYFISSPKRYVAFAGMLMTSEGLFIGPQTLKQISAFLKGKYSKSYLDGNQKIGKEFEDYVAKEIVKSGFRITPPADPTKILINLKDDDNHPSLEIDILAEYDDHLYIIECKNIVISTDFITQNRENTVKKRLRGEKQKQKRRYEYVKKNLKNLGFDPHAIKSVHYVIVTYNKEPLEEYNGIKLVSVKELETLKHFNK